MMKLSTPSLSLPAVTDAALEASLHEVEQTLAALGAALHARDASAIDLHATALHQALASAIDHFARAAQNGPLSPALRNRLVRASGQVAAQRESLARATAALDRAIEVLIPADVPAVYSAYGSGQRGMRNSFIQA
ncbi:MAG: hypothetical protein V4739_01010 [Pseudomonadota bacterium]